MSPAFPGPEVMHDQILLPRDPPMHLRVMFLVTASVVALLGTGLVVLGLPNMLWLPGAVMFPGGLIPFVPGAIRSIGFPPMFILTAGWGLYCGLAIALLRARRPRAWLALFVIFVLLLGVNAVGCYTQAKAKRLVDLRTSSTADA